MYRKSAKKEEDPDKKPKLSYWSKTKCICPVCQRPFEKEEMLTGSGRMNAGDLTDELHRKYIPSEKYGAVYPLIYAVGACPRCHVAFLWKDFEDIKDPASIDALRDDDENRKKKVEAIFPHYELTRERNLLDGAAMYYLALLSYEKVDLAYAPTFKRAMISLRLAWICNHLNETIPGYNYDYIAKQFYQKATFFYEQTMINEMSRVESFSPVSNFGPDIDKNYGYDGMIYLIGLLEFKYGQTDDLPLRYKKLDAAKRAIARGFGLGKSSKAKPGPLLENARNLYDKITDLIKESNTIDFSDDDDDEE
ncbi:DUF2225 domain-containing protein [Treponema ruminis]|uniref:DUF2225 domain-containing protein n=1 Tax=Treponema ruminis TaxID=744515 RepID=A0A7W8LLU4_9SPIR|nr:DUF2225 domain-containing protein [Treponema ruminis]MBB5225826.1 hypothetical protein [Treponema ruminis]QSI02515.1 DUF2225 domain-containing protein [Treponema ruminis]